jgi:N-acetyl sugar amidotransferase
METNNLQGKQLFENLEYCSRCCLPVTAEGLALDEMGICQPCRSSEQKIHIDWVEREKALKVILESYRGKSKSGYDVLVPISGGKDSIFQLYILTQIYKLRCLAVTFSHNWFTETGKHNLKVSLETFNVDHIMFTPNHSTISKLARESLYKIGDSCWHCHAGVGAFPLKIAVMYEIPLLVWGESVSESDGRATYEEPIKFDRDYFTKVSARFYAEEMVGKDITIQEVQPFVLPSYDDIQRVGVVGIHLGDYIFWDDERQMEFVRDKFGWREEKVDGTYKQFKSVECKMTGLHDYTKFLKRGFGRATDHASRDVRAGIMTREEGFDLIREYDTKRPAILDWYLEITGISEEEFMKVIRDHRENVMGDSVCKACENCNVF